MGLASEPDARRRRNWITGSYDPDLNETYWGVAQAKPWMRVSRGAKPGDKALFTSSTVALNPGQWQSRLVLPACARRIARSRRGVRARAGGQRRQEADVYHRQGGHSVEARPRERASSSGSRRRSSRTSSRESIRRQESRRIAATFSSRRSASGFRRVRARKADTTGRR